MTDVSTSEVKFKDPVAEKFGFSEADDNPVLDAPANGAESKEEILESLKPATPEKQYFDITNLTHEELNQLINLPSRESADRDELYNSEYNRRLAQVEQHHWNSRVQKMVDDGLTFEKTHPDMSEAVEYLIDGYKAELSEQGFNSEEVQKHLSNTVRQLDITAQKKKISTPHLAYNLAVSRGYKPPKGSQPTRPNNSSIDDLNSLLHSSDNDFDANFIKILKSKGTNGIRRRGFNG